MTVWQQTSLPQNSCKRAYAKGFQTHSKDVKENAERATYNPHDNRESAKRLEKGDVKNGLAVCTNTIRPSPLHTMTAQVRPVSQSIQTHNTRLLLPLLPRRHRAA